MRFAARTVASQVEYGDCNGEALAFDPIDNAMPEKHVLTLPLAHPLVGSLHAADLFVCPLHQVLFTIARSSMRITFAMTASLVVPKAFRLLALLYGQVEALCTSS